MAGTTTKQTFPYPTGTDAPFVHLDVKALADALDGRVVTYCTSGTRPTGSARFNGAVIFETDTLRYRWWDGSVWQALAPINKTVVVGATVGTYDSTRPITTWSINKSMTTDGNGDGIVLNASDFAGGCILSASIGGADVFNLTVACRALTGNLVGRVWNGTTLVTSSSVQITGMVYGQS